jgi:hypothetical protein
MGHINLHIDLKTFCCSHGGIIHCRDSKGDCVLSISLRELCSIFTRVMTLLNLLTFSVHLLIYSNVKNELKMHVILSMEDMPLKTC